MINEVKNTMQCPVCQEFHPTLIHHFNTISDTPILRKLEEELSGWTADMGVCTRCIDQAQLDGWEESKTTNPYSEQIEYTILPISKRLGAHPDFTGKGVTICFIDSGFYPHPDIADRILVMEDLSGQSQKNIAHAVPDQNSWHGTMTSVAGAGDGKMSNGYYKSMASASKLVLLKVADEQGKISGENIAKAIKWAIAHQKEYQIRILNLSVTDDWATSYRTNIVSQAIEEAVNKGIVVVVAAGNDENAYLKAPANSPHAITVGGLDDHNTLHPLMSHLYHSTFGVTVDGVQKPDLIAPAIWIPVPILPHTPAHQAALWLFDAHTTTNKQYLKAKYANIAVHLGLDALPESATAEEIRQSLSSAIQNRKLISRHYQHADGTSFAAPIVTSIVAQLLEANPLLTPSGVRSILLQTTRKLPNVSVERQGFGVVHPLSALCAVKDVAFPDDQRFTPLINYQKKTIEFRLQRKVKSAAITGDFTHWNQMGIPLKTPKEGYWKLCQDLLPSGVYRYKYILNAEEWISDPTNLFQELDGFGGFNSNLIIE